MMDFSGTLLESATGTDFLRRAEARLKESDAGFSYADFARKAGFSARSYVREVFIGKKTLTLKALPQFANALGLRREEREVFRCLLAIENPDFDPSLRGETAVRTLRARTAAIQRRAERRPLARPMESLEGSSSNLRLEYWPRVFAALGGDSSFASIVRKTGLSALIVERILRAMIDADLVRQDGDAYSVVGPHVVLDPATHSEMIQKTFASVASAAIEGSRSNFQDPNRVFFVSSFGVKSSRLPELKKRLIETMLRFVEETGDDAPDEVVSIATTLI